jgi:hypothetical protein
MEGEAIGNSLGNLRPSSPRLKDILLFQRCDVQLRQLDVAGLEGINSLGFLPMALLELELVRPLTLSRVEGPRLGPITFFPHGSSEGVLLPRQPASAREIDLGNVARRRRDMDALAELDEGGAIYQVLDVQCRQGDEVGLLLLAVGRLQCQQRVADLLDVNRSTETCFLAIVTL